MEKRTQRYSDESGPKEPTRVSRTDKNKLLYDDINNYIGVEEISNLDTQTKIDLSQLSSYEEKREDFHKVKDYKDFFYKNKPEEKQEEEPIVVSEKKVYDINSVLEEAKKNRIKYDELEKKRKLRENEYTTLADINDKEAYSKPSKNEIDENELTNLINTITSHTLLQEIKDAEKELEENPDSIKDEEDIFSDLIATNVDLNLEEGIAKEFTSENNMSNIDESFYTKSMDLSEQDFEFSEEFERDKKLKIKIIIIVTMIILILGVVAFVVLKKKGII